MIEEILSDLGANCRDAARRALLTDPSLGLNGIDYVEYARVGTDDVLQVHFIHPLPLPDPYGLQSSPERILIAGGARITGVTAMNAAAAGNVLTVRVSAQGDFARYWVIIGWTRGPDGRWTFALPGVDRQFSVAPINFRPDCPVEFDCADTTSCTTGELAEPNLDYLAKDYASFRQLLLDLAAQRNPGWIERNPADLGIALLELFAYEGDRLSYFQDAVANEAYLDTARQRSSAKRHAKLVDYAMHDGRNAWTHVHFTVDAAVTIPLGARLLTRISAPVQRLRATPGVLIPPTLTDEDFETDTPLVRARVFETAHDLRAVVANNAIRLHDWGNDECCLPRGTVTAHLFSVDRSATPRRAIRPVLAAGDLLLLEEVRSPETGAAADADPTHRQVVQISYVRQLTDDVFAEDLVGTGDVLTLQKRTGAANALPLLEVTWRTVDALTFPLCLSRKRPDSSMIREVSVARGNLVLADHGRSVVDRFSIDPPVQPDSRFRLPLRRGPLTMQCQPDDMSYDPTTGAQATRRVRLDCDARLARPAVALVVTGASPDPEVWTAVPDLLGSSSFDRHFVADIDGRGVATVRFGDGDYGRETAGATSITVWQRVGNGTSGNIGADSLAHIVWSGGGTPAIRAIRNPLPASGGVDAESIEEVRQYAPAAFKARQFRAVTEADYAAAAKTLDGVAGAVATFRWTGSWYTVYLGIDPLRSDDLITESGGRTRLGADFERSVREGINRYMLAGYDLEIRSARYIPLQVAIEICVAPGYFRGDVREAVIRALSGASTARGRSGFFDPEHFTFGQPVYLSALYAALLGVQGVASANVTVFHPYGRDARGELEAGFIPIGPWEIARLDNDRNRMENGVLTVTVGGGK